MPGAAVLVYRTTAWRKVRCQKCGQKAAKEPVPDLPPLARLAPPPEREPVPVQSLVHSLPLDWRRSREPGEDDD